jgi:putative ABC transport system permease protein
MIRYLPYILKTLWRHRTRTLLTVSGTAVALLVFSFVTAVQEGLSRLLDDREQERTLIVFQANRFCPSTSKLPEDYARRIERLDGVERAVPIKVFMNNCRASLDVVVFNGLPPGNLRQVRDLELLEGNWETFEKQQDAAVVGQAIADRRKLKVGQRFSIGALTVTVTGVFRSPDKSTESMIFTHLDFLQRTRGLNSVGTVTQLEVQLAESADVQATSRAIDDLFSSGPIATNTRTKGVFQASAVGDLVELVGFTQYLGLACVGLVLGLVATTTVMGVQDRIKEHAVLQTMGFTGWHIFAFVIAESLIVSLVGGLIGVGSALAILGTQNMALGTEGILITFLPSLTLALTGLAAAAAVGILAGLIPASQAARTEIVPALRFG